MIAAMAGKNIQQSWWLCGKHFLAIATITEIIWKLAYMYMETAQQSTSQRLLNFFGSHRSDHMKTSLYGVKFHLMHIQTLMSKWELLAEYKI